MAAENFTVTSHQDPSSEVSAVSRHMAIQRDVISPVGDVFLQMIAGDLVTSLRRLG